MFVFHSGSFSSITQNTKSHTNICVVSTPFNLSLMRKKPPLDRAPFSAEGIREVMTDFPLVKMVLRSVCVCACACVCMYSNSRNDVPRVARRYGTIAAHTRRRASVLVVFVVFCVHMHRFAGLIRRTPPPTFSDTTITDRHSDTTIFQLRAHCVRIS